MNSEIITNGCITSTSNASLSVMGFLGLMWAVSMWFLIFRIEEVKKLKEANGFLEKMLNQNGEQHLKEVEENEKLRQVNSHLRSRLK